MLTDSPIRSKLPAARGSSNCCWRIWWRCKYTPRMPSLATHNAPAEASATSPVISLTGLVVRYGHRTALDQLTATLSGRAIGLLGPNGAGKSTLISALLGFLRPTAGTARLLDLDLGRD